jgi:hypothetical protein
MRDHIRYTDVSIGPKDLYRECTSIIKSKWFRIKMNTLLDPWKMIKMSKWCKDNCTGRWSIEEDNTGIKPVFYFKTVRDRLAFILAWS